MESRDVAKKEIRKIPGVAQPQESRSVFPSFTGGMMIGVILLLVLVHIGFSKTYIQYFPRFDGFRATQHFHGMMMMGWLLMLLVQPFLIAKGKISLHRRIGALSYVMAPLVLLSMYLVTQSRFYSIAEQSGYAAGVARLALNFPLLVFFALLYSLGIYYKRKPRLHMRFMCSTVFLMIGPALARALRTYQGFTADESVSITRIAIVVIAGAIMTVDSVRTKRVSPFILVFLLMVLHAILWDERHGGFWMTIGRVIAKLF